MEEGYYTWQSVKLVTAKSPAVMPEDSDDI
jgi:hypothetical protein